jgi:hypothetical protein
MSSVRVEASELGLKRELPKRSGLGGYWALSLRLPAPIGLLVGFVWGQSRGGGGVLCDRGGSEVKSLSEVLCQGWVRNVTVE